MPKQAQPYAGLDVVLTGKKDHLCCVKYCRKHRAKGRRICHNHKMIAWRLANPLQAAYATLRDHATRRKVEFTITIKQFEELVVPSGYLTHKGNTKDDLHIDRIRPLEGYIPGNLQILTCSENSAKGATKDKRAYVEERIAKRKSKKDREAEAHADKHFYKHQDEDRNPF